MLAVLKTYGVSQAKIGDFQVVFTPNYVDMAQAIMPKMEGVNYGDELQ
jgi:hypothetical protein